MIAMMSFPRTMAAVPLTELPAAEGPVPETVEGGVEFGALLGAAEAVPIKTEVAPPLASANSAPLVPAVVRAICGVNAPALWPVIADPQAICAAPIYDTPAEIPPLEITTPEDSGLERPAECSLPLMPELLVVQVNPPPPCRPEHPDQPDTSTAVDPVLNPPDIEKPAAALPTDAEQPVMPALEIAGRVTQAAPEQDPEPTHTPTSAATPALPIAIHPSVQRTGAIETNPEPVRVVRDRPLSGPMPISEKSPPTAIGKADQINASNPPDPISVKAHNLTGLAMPDQAADGKADQTSASNPPDNKSTKAHNPTGLATHDQTAVSDGLTLPHSSPALASAGIPPKDPISGNVQVAPSDARPAPPVMKAGAPPAPIQ